MDNWCKTWDWIDNERITIAKENVELENKKKWQEMYEHTWAAPGCIIYFFLHQDLGNKNMKETCKVFGLNVIIHVILSTLTFTLDYLY